MEKDLIYVRASGATHRLVLLHGWGADVDDLIPLGQELSKLVSSSRIELVALRAPGEHPGGFGRQWYGLFPPDWAAVPSAIVELKSRIKTLCTPLIPLEKTVIFGFSQGGAMAVAVGSELSMAGVIACSAYPHPFWIPQVKSTPVLLFHGKNDEIVPCEASRKLLDSFKENNSKVDLVLFEGGHQIPEQLLPRIQLSLKEWFI